MFTHRYSIFWLSLLFSYLNSISHSRARNILYGEIFFMVKYKNLRYFSCPIAKSYKIFKNLKLTIPLTLSLYTPSATKNQTLVLVYNYNLVKQEIECKQVNKKKFWLSCLPSVLNTVCLMTYLRFLLIKWNCFRIIVFLRSKPTSLYVCLEVK